VAPVRILRGAFADAVPRRDLLVSPNHAIYVDRRLICADQLINGTTIRQETNGRSIEYFHVELDAHAIIQAEGLPTESYLDTGNRGFFSNSGVPLLLHPDLTVETNHSTRDAGSCAPFAWDAASVRPVWQRLADRANALGRPVVEPCTTTDPALKLVADGRRIPPISGQSDPIAFILPRRTAEIRLISRAGSPTDARPWLGDRRRLGVPVARIVMRHGRDVYEMPLDSPDLSEGWWAIERDGIAMRRWTNGDAVLPLPALSGPLILEIHLGGEMIYVVNSSIDVETGVEKAWAGRG
jgi:hypothetical protein